MGMTDPIADMLTRIRNANQMHHETVNIPASKVKMEILNVLQKEGYIGEFEKVENGVHSQIKVALKYVDKVRVIKGLKRISKPGLRIYAKADELPKVLNGLGVAIISTSCGIMSDREARRQKLGGEVVAFVW